MTIIITNSASVQGTGKEILGSFSIGGLIGGLLGLAWVALSKQLRTINFFYMLTLAILLLAYIISEYFGGSGAIAALIFGIMLGNYKEIGQMLRFRNVAEDTELFTFQNEIGFIVRAFYFVYLGALVVIGSTYSVLVGLAIMAGLIVSRLASTQLATLGSDLARYRWHINVFMPRGLAAAVMGTYPLTVLLESQGAILAGVYGPLLVQANLFVEVSFVVIVASVILTSIGVFFVRRSDAAKEREGKETAGEPEGMAGEKKAEEGEGVEKEPDPYLEEGETIGREDKEGAKKQKGS
jgi:cell volume regulation protein A